jgi:hypothetical protein
MLSKNRILLNIKPVFYYLSILGNHITGNLGKRLPHLTWFGNLEKISLTQVGNQDRFRAKTEFKTAKNEKISELNSYNTSIKYELVKAYYKEVDKVDISCVKNVIYPDELIFMFQIGEVDNSHNNNFKSRIIFTLEILLLLEEYLLKDEIKNIYFIGHSEGMVSSIIMSYIIMCIQNKMFSKMNNIYDCAINEFFGEHIEEKRALYNLKNILGKISVVGSGGFPLVFNDKNIFDEYYKLIEHRYIHFLLKSGDSDNYDEFIFSDRNKNKRNNNDLSLSCDIIYNDDTYTTISNFELIPIILSLSVVSLGEVEYVEPELNVDDVFFTAEYFHNYENYRRNISYILYDDIVELMQKFKEKDGEKTVYNEGGNYKRYIKYKIKNK